MEFIETRNLYIIIIIILVVLLIISIIILSNSDENKEKMDHISITELPIYIINMNNKPERYKYVSEQLDNMKLSNYKRWVATDGFTADPKEMMKDGIMKSLINEGMGIAGCASSHIKLWKHIAKHKLGWTLILEDDVHFHPKFQSLFIKYWKNVPIDAKIVYVGHCYASCKNSTKKVIKNYVMCNHGYMINHESAQYLIDNLLPMGNPIDRVIYDHFSKNDGSFIFNGSTNIDGICPDEYKMSNCNICSFEGIIYQNREKYKSTINV